MLGVGVGGGGRPFGLRIRLEGTEKISYPAETLIYSAGSVFNLLSLLIPKMGDDFYRFSIGAAAFNLLPLVGSDGMGIILSAASCFLSPLSVTRLEGVLGRLTLFLLWLFSVAANVTGNGSLAFLLVTTYALVSELTKKRHF